VKLHPETREAARLVAFIVCGFFAGLTGLVIIIVYFMNYS
jgi:hypothetical protein